MSACVCACMRASVSLSLTHEVLHALGRLDDLGAHRGAADAVQRVVGFGDNLRRNTAGVRLLPEQGQRYRHDIQKH